MSYEKVQERVHKLPQLYEELSSDEDSSSDAGESCEDFEVHNRKETSDSDEEVGEENRSENDTCRNEKVFLGRDKHTKWIDCILPNNVRTHKAIIVSHLRECEECFMLFLDDTIISKIAEYTNIYIGSIANRYGRERDAKRTSTSEVKTIIGLLILAGVCRAGHQNLEDLWDQDGLGIYIFHTTMSLRRFLFLLPAFREIFELFLENSIKHCPDSLLSMNSLSLSEEEPN
ncbi:hypothetical protein PR048_020505 [Dryococelus australis]|uniref:PiggyBac transposable element-derived protein domain-containing protein n=1 Tax=Dryococelus australis TaxID=614101 RepID=A0ABQ9H6G0_9NEOP|nr:hypothetical protein PR048_020505 [Dryococelus australis]